MSAAEHFVTIAENQIKTINGMALFKKMRNRFATQKAIDTVLEHWPAHQNKNQLLSTFTATNLYWFGRHLQRIESILIDILVLFDVIIDTDKKAAKRYYANLDIDLKYDGASEFMQQAILGDHPANLATLMLNAYENAIICRTQLDSDAFGEAIRLHMLLDTFVKTNQPVDFRLIEQALSLINEIWGMMARGLVRRKSDHFIRLGRLVEKVDLHLRLGKDGYESVIYLHNILHTAQRIAPKAKLAISETDEEANLEAINTLIDRLIEG